MPNTYVAAVSRRCRAVEEDTSDVWLFCIRKMFISWWELA
jgi:hypothetical protein